MGSCYVAVTNLASRRQFPNHVLSATEEPAGYEPFRAADGRRSPYDYATASTDDQAWSHVVTCDQPRSSSFFALDRVHNLTGFQVVGEISDDGFTTVETVFDVVISSAVGGILDSALGVRTREGAWLIRYAARTAHEWRVRIPAMGAENVPIVGGLWWSQAYRVPRLVMPRQDETEWTGEEFPNRLGALGADKGGLRRSGTLRFRLDSGIAYSEFDYHFNTHFARRRPMWLIEDDDEPERAVLAIRRPPPMGIARRTRDYFFPSGEIPWVEHEPAELT